jgi:PIF1-like helicase/Helix-turn-helix domain/HRDC domain/Helicase
VFILAISWLNLFTVATFTPDTTNTLFQLASALVNQSSRNIFLTGKAGTGKTTFLKYIRENCPKQMAVVAPTGVAAINAGGVTIHSFFQLPLSPFIPEARGFSKNNDETINRHSLISRLRINTEKKKVLQQLELLIIDEISMVRCDTIDAIDTVLRHIRKKPFERFGGVQVLFIGDMFQLPPVIREQEWGILSEFYANPYFFAGKVIEEEPPLYIEFNKIYRQSEEKFISLLNQVRNNELNEEGAKLLDKRFQPAFRRTNQDGYIILTTHNEKAREINAQELRSLDGPMFSFEAQIEEEFPENAYPADHTLYLKTGAQVMFIRNDMDRSKRYFNGKIGIVTKLAKDKIFVQCENDPDEIEVKMEKWENIRYTMNKSTRSMEENTLGSFSQYPLRLAWAITIHKSQGLTFEKAIIDAGSAFAPGQVYVALSRCTSLEGMVLKSKVSSNSLFSDPRIVQFSQSMASSHQLQEELAGAKRNYQFTVLVSTFDFITAANTLKELTEYFSENQSSFNPETASWIDEFSEKINSLQITAIKFHQWLRNQYQLAEAPEGNKILQERIIKGTDHFMKGIQSAIEFLQSSPAVTDSRLHAKEYNEQVKEIFAELSLKQFLMQGLNGQIDIEAWHRRKKNFVLPSFSVNAYAAGSQQKSVSPHPLLQQRLRKMRDSICAKKGLPIYIVAGSKTIDEMAMYLPQTLIELRMISGFGDAKIEKYGQQFLNVVLEYCKENNLSSLIKEKLPKRERKEPTGEKKIRVDTKAESFRLYKEGTPIADISKGRNLAIQTIEGHLAHYVEMGEINIDELVTPEKLSQIEPMIKDFNGGPMTPIKEKLGDAVSFGEIRLAIAWQQYKKNTADPGS